MKDPARGSIAPPATDLDGPTTTVSPGHITVACSHARYTLCGYARSSAVVTKQNICILDLPEHIGHLAFSCPSIYMSVWKPGESSRHSSAIDLHRCRSPEHPTRSTPDTFSDTYIAICIHVTAARSCNWTSCSASHRPITHSRTRGGVSFF